MIIPFFLSLFIASIYALIFETFSLPFLDQFYLIDINETLLHVNSINVSVPFYYDLISLFGANDYSSLIILRFINLFLLLYVYFSIYQNEKSKNLVYFFLFPAILIFGYTTSRTVFSVILILSFAYYYYFFKMKIVSIIFLILIFLNRGFDGFVIIALLIFFYLFERHGKIVFYIFTLAIFGSLLLISDFFELYYLGEQVDGRLSFRTDDMGSISSNLLKVFDPIIMLPKFINDPYVMYQVAFSTSLFFLLIRSKFVPGIYFLLFIFILLSSLSSNYASIFRWAFPYFILIIFLSSKKTTYKIF